MTRLQGALRAHLRLHSGETLTREQLCSAVWRMNYFPNSRTIDQTLSIVRKHLGENERIVTVSGIGYRHESLAKDRFALAHTLPESEILAAGERALVATFGA